MRRIARNLELSVAVHGESASDAMRAERRADLGRLPNRIERLAALGIDSLAGRAPIVASAALDGLARAVGNVSYLGSGFHASVYRRGNEVLKVYRDTAQMDEAQRQAEAARRAEACAEFVTQFGPRAVVQAFDVEEHPLGDYRVVTGYQPYVDGGRLDLFTINTLELKDRDIKNYLDRQEMGRRHLGELIEGTFASDEAVGLVPDINGHDNFRLVGTDEALVLIDPEPIGREHPGVYSHILRQAEVLGSYLG